jgi:hypothetical protein
MITNSAGFVTFGRNLVFFAVILSKKPEHDSGPAYDPMERTRIYHDHPGVHSCRRRELLAAVPVFGSRSR